MQKLQQKEHKYYTWNTSLKPAISLTQLKNTLQVFALLTAGQYRIKLLALTPGQAQTFSRLRSRTSDFPNCKSATPVFKFVLKTKSPANNTVCPLIHCRLTGLAKAWAPTQH